MKFFYPNILLDSNISNQTVYIQRVTTLHIKWSASSITLSFLELICLLNNEATFRSLLITFLTSMSIQQTPTLMGRFVTYHYGRKMFIDQINSIAF